MSKVHGRRESEKTTHAEATLPAAGETCVLQVKARARALFSSVPDGEGTSCPTTIHQRRGAVDLARLRVKKQETALPASC